MARKPRIHFPGALYHVITRGNRRQGVFLDEKYLERFLTYLSDCKSRFPFRLYAYALMQNHLHFLIEVGGIPLSRIMQSLLPCFRCLTPISLEEREDMPRQTRLDAPGSLHHVIIAESRAGGLLMTIRIERISFPSGGSIDIRGFKDSWEMTE